jgi:serine/threonine-protein kinase
VTEPLAPGALRAHLDRALGDHYVIERELGGAGMSRVFVARELALGRSVVLKVLPPELAAGLNVERFRREIQLAAGLQHPHVVPVLSAGSAAGVPYYAMPMVEGESLRARIARDGPLPVAEAVRVLHDVADALAHAHVRGIVHRDVKPDNVLLSGRHALVTDFGVAKALRTAFATPGAGLDPDATGAGLAIGTPAYMAPEQAAADPSVDHRADLYAFGVLAYETLAGVPPFRGRTPAEVLSAHLAETPEPLGARRPDVPAALATLVMRCLAKRPEDRPTDAGAVRDALTAVSTPLAGMPGIETTVEAPGWQPVVPPRMGVGRGLLALMIVGLLAVTGASTMLLWPRRAPLDEALVAVAPFRVAGGDPSLRYLREGMLDLLAATLTGQDGPRAADPRALLSAWRRSAGSDADGETGDLPRDRALEVAEGLGAGRLLMGEISGTAQHVVLTASLLQVRDGRARAPVRIEGSADSLPRLVERLAVALLALDAIGGDRTRAINTTSLPALRAYLHGQALYRRSRYRESAREYDRALSLDTTFAQAGLGLATSAQWFGEPDQVTRGLQAAWRERTRLSPADVASLEAAGGPRFPAYPTMGEVYAAKLRYARVAPDRPDAVFEAGDALFHFGTLMGEPEAHGRAAAEFRKVLALDSTFLPALEHLVLIAARASDTAAVRRYGSLFLATDSSSEGADAVRWRIAVALGDTATLTRLERRAAEMHPISAHLIDEVAMIDGVDLERAERIRAAHVLGKRVAQSASERLTSAVIAHDVALARGHPARAAALLGDMRDAGYPPHLTAATAVLDAVFGEGDTTAAVGALRVLEPLAYAPAPSALPDRMKQETALCASEMWHISQGDTRRLAAAVTRLRTPASGPLPQGAETPTRGARACAILLEAAGAAHAAHGQAVPPPSTLAVADRLDSLVRTGQAGLTTDVGPLVLARLRELLGDERGALVALRRRPYLYTRQPYLASVLREEARLAARVGDRGGAARAARHFAALRRGGIVEPDDVGRDARESPEPRPRVDVSRNAGDAPLDDV